MKTINLAHDHGVTVVDDTAYERLAQHNWYLTHGHASRGGKVTGVVFMHNDVIGYPPEGMQVDHINRDKLDNRRENLRFVTFAQQRQNVKRGKSKYLGVSWHTQCLKWWATIKKDKKQYSLGLHHNEQDAALAYDRKARELYGREATLNFPRGDELLPDTNNAQLNAAPSAVSNGQ